MYRFGQKRRYLCGCSDAGTRHSSKQKLYGDDSCPSQPQSQKGIGGLLLEFWIGAISWVSLVTHVVSCITSIMISYVKTRNERDYPRPFPLPTPIWFYFPVLYT